jgi:hypothetical protein
LRVSFFFKEDEFLVNDFPYKVTTDKIEWNEGKDVTKKIVKKVKNI